MTYGIITEEEIRSDMLGHTRTFGGELRVIFSPSTATHFVQWSKGLHTAFLQFGNTDHNTWGASMVRKIKECLEE